MILKPERLEDAKMSVKKWHKHQPVNWECEARFDIETKNDWSYIIWHFSVGHLSSSKDRRPNDHFFKWPTEKCQM